MARDFDASLSVVQRDLTSAKARIAELETALREIDQIRQVMADTGMKQKMSEEQIRIKCAGLCGWTKEENYAFYQGGGGNGNIVTTAWFFPYDKLHTNPRYSCDLPNYPSDLNACADFKAHMDREQSVRFRLRLMFLSDGPSAEYSTVEEALCDATALQRCLAFLHVHGIEAEVSE